jgi:hypothetical protein
MKHVFAVILATLSIPALAATIESELKGSCVVHAYGWSQVFHKVDVPFTFDGKATVPADDGNVYTFGTGSALIDQNIEMMDANKNIIEKPIRIAITVATSPDLKRKHLRVVLRMFNIFKGHSENIVMDGLSTFDKAVFENFAYFQTGFVHPDAGSVPHDQVTGSSVFCHFSGQR